MVSSSVIGKDERIAGVSYDDFILMQLGKSGIKEANGFIIKNGAYLCFARPLLGYHKEGVVSDIGPRGNASMYSGRVFDFSYLTPQDMDNEGTPNCTISFIDVNDIVSGKIVYTKSEDPEDKSINLTWFANNDSETVTVYDSKQGGFIEQTARLWLGGQIDRVEVGGVSPRSIKCFSKIVYGVAGFNYYFYYKTRYCIEGKNREDDTLPRGLKPMVDSNDDTFLLDDELLILGATMYFKSYLSLDNTVEQANYQDYLEHLKTARGSTRAITQNSDYNRGIPMLNNRSEAFPQGTPINLGGRGR